MAVGFFFVCGLLLLIVGAEVLVRGATRLALELGISPLLVGLTVVAYATSSPELAVSVVSVRAGQGFEVFVVTDASGTFTPVSRDAAWDRMSAAGAQLMNWFAVVGELHRDWRNDVEGLGGIMAGRIPAYRNLMASYNSAQK